MFLLLLLRWLYNFPLFFRSMSYMNQNSPQDLELHHHPPLQQHVVLFHPWVVWAELQPVSFNQSDCLHHAGLRCWQHFCQRLCLSMACTSESVRCQRRPHRRVVLVITVPWFVNMFTSSIPKIMFMPNFFREN